MDGRSLPDSAGAVFDGHDVLLPIAGAVHLVRRGVVEIVGGKLRIVANGSEAASVHLVQRGLRQAVRLSELCAPLGLSMAVDGGTCRILTRPRVQSPDSLDVPNARTPAPVGGAIYGPPVPNPRAPIPPSTAIRPGQAAPDTGRDVATPGSAFSGSGVSVQPPVRPSVLGDIALVDEGLDRVSLRVATSTKVTVAGRMSKGLRRIVFTVKNAVLVRGAKSYPFEHATVMSASVTADAVRREVSVSVDLTRLVTYRIVYGSDGFSVEFAPPKNAGKGIGHARIVIDPGHGGAKTGCSTVVDGVRVYEKDLVLTISRKLERILADAGASVLLTRTDDTDVPFDARPGLANDNSADVFVSIHIDDFPGSATATGSTTYYHRQDQDGRALAQAILDQMTSVSGLPSRGARSDYERFPDRGMVVLRLAKVPSCLVEIAYISNPLDREKLLTPEFQQIIAYSIADGLRLYLDGSAGVAPVPPIPGG